MAKLHVPPPEGPDDRSDVNLAILLAVGLIGLGFYGFVNQEPYDATGASPDVPETGEELDPLQQELKAQRARSQQLSEFGDAQLEKMEWSAEDRTVVMRFGPRAASEIVCRKLLEEAKAGDLPKQMRLELEKTLDRRTEFAPWTCMTRAYLAGELPEGELRKEMAEFWMELETHQGNARLPASIIEDIRETRERPENPRFWHWARMCAFDYEYQAATECRKLLYQISPEQGGDLLLMLEKHWAKSGIAPAEVPTIVAGLGHLARNGQPHNWTVDETKELPDYDVDFRQAAVGYLCRMANTPTPDEREGLQSKFDDVPALAAEQLRKVGLVGARAYEARLLMRWREACRIAFGGRGGYKDDEEYVPVPLLAVWNGEVNNPPDYRITSAIDRGDCEVKEGYPTWFCLADEWTDEERTLDRALAHAFIETRYMEWDDAFAPPKRDETPPEEDEPANDEPETSEKQETKSEVPEKPEAKSEEPEAKIEKPEAKSEKPEVKSEKPEVKSEKPEVKSEEAEKPEAKSEEAEKPEAKSEKPEAKIEKPEAKSDEPEKPEAESDEPGAKSDEPTE